MPRQGTHARRAVALAGLALVIGTVTVAAPRRGVTAEAPLTPSTTVTAPTAPTTTVAATTTTTVPPVPATNQAAPAQVCAPVSAPAAGATTDLATPTSAAVTYAATPGGPAAGPVASHWGGPSSRPVVAQQNGWIQIRLAARPNGKTGWVRSTDVTVATTAYRVVISTCQRSLTVFQGPTPVYSAPVGVGRPQWPTPAGSTFVDAVLAMPRREVSVYGPTVFVLGTHSNVFTDFGGGDGTVAIHAYPSDPASTRGVASSHGCIRVGPATIDFLSGVPVGTPVDVL